MKPSVGSAAPLIKVNAVSGWIDETWTTEMFETGIKVIELFAPMA